MSNLGTILTTISAIILLLISIITTIYTVLETKKAKKLEEEILSKKKEIEQVPAKILPTIQNSLVTQSQLDKMVEKKQKTLREELERLKLERQFIIERLPLVGLFKK
jgi:hypothetical protein